MRETTLTIALVSVLLTGCAGDEPADSTPDADLLLTNGRVYTLDWESPAPDGSVSTTAPFGEAGWYPDAGAVAVIGGTIAFVGSTEEAMAYRGATTRVIDLAGATVLPGLIDSHTHVFELGRSMQQVDLTGVATEAEAVALIAERAATIARDPTRMWPTTPACAASVA